MTTTVQKWGNSSGVRIPKAVLDETFINLNDEVDVFAENNKIIISKTRKRSRVPLAERLKDYKGDYKFEEADWGPPVGREIW